MHTKIQIGSGDGTQREKKSKKQGTDKADAEGLRRVNGLWEASLPSFRAATSITIVNRPGQFSKGKQLLDALS